MNWSKHRGPGEGRRGYHHGNLREALIRGALALIAEKGPAGFTIADAARSAGVSPAAPYRHFRDRDELLADVARRGFELFEAALAKSWDEDVPIPSLLSTASAKPIWPSPATSRLIIRRCSKRAFRTKPMPNSGKPATAPSACCAPPRKNCSARYPGRTARRR
jgi:AcrR family transcriptional regulator